MQNEFSSGALAASQSASMQALAMTWRSFGQVYDMGLTVAQVMLRSQARAAGALGLPDVSDTIAPPDQRLSHVFADGAEQLVAGAQKAADDGAELQRQLSETIEAQTAAVTDRLQTGMEELAAQTRDSLARLQDAAEQVGEQVSAQVIEQTQRAAEQTQQFAASAAKATEHLTPEAIVARDGPFKPAE